MKIGSTGCLQGKTAIVTGATQGLGADIAQSLVAAGAQVFIVGRGREAGMRVAGHLGEAAHFIEADITEDAAIAHCIETVMATCSRLDILVNNACSYDDQGLQSTRQQWLNTLNVNLVSAALFTQQAAVQMTAGSVVINIGSTGGKFGAAGRAVYPASKAGLIQITRNFAVTLAPRQIRVLSISPAWTWSPAVEQMSGGSCEVADRVAAPFHPLGRIGRGDDVGRVVVFAASEDAAWMTGVDIPVDGGFSILGPDQGCSPREWFTRLNVEGF